MTADYTISDVMTGCPYDISIETSLREAKDMMAVKAIRNLPVVEEGALVGILCQSALESAIARGGAEDAIRNLKLEAAYVVRPDELLSEVAGHMAEKKLSCALIADEEKIVGIFTTTDACRAIQMILENLED